MAHVRQCARRMQRQRERTSQPADHASLAGSVAPSLADIPPCLPPPSRSSAGSLAQSAGVESVGIVHVALARYTARCSRYPWESSTWCSPGMPPTATCHFSCPFLGCPLTSACGPMAWPSLRTQRPPINAEQSRYLMESGVDGEVSNKTPTISWRLKFNNSSLPFWRAILKIQRPTVKASGYLDESTAPASNFGSLPPEPALSSLGKILSQHLDLPLRHVIHLFEGCA